MSNVYLHIILSHIPVIGMLFGIILLITAGVKKNHELKRVAIGFFILIAISAFPVFFTGHAAEEAVEHLPWASESLIEQHEEWAAAVPIATGILGIAALGGLLLAGKSKNIPAWFFRSFLITVIATAGLTAYTAKLGGQIRHTELRSGSVPSLSDSAYTPEIKDDKHSQSNKSYNIKFYGIVESMPERGYEGVWVIEGKGVLVTKNTFIEEEHGKASVGTYIKVKGNRTGENITAYEIEVKEDR